MFRIRCVHDAVLPINRLAIEQVQEIIRNQFSDVADHKVKEIPEKLHNPMKYDFRSVLLVCDDRKGRVRGFALFSIEPSLKFGFLDLIALSESTKGGGIGAALYQRVQEESLSLGLQRLFYECLTDLPEYNTETSLPENKARLRFYERMGGRPVIGTEYEKPRRINAGNAYFLMVDNLIDDTPPDRDTAISAVKAILRRKYKNTLAHRQITEIIESFHDDPVRVRPLKYIKKPKPHNLPPISRDKKIILCVSDKHVIHHIKDHGYVELPVRVNSILDELNKTELFERQAHKRFSDKHILAVHDKRFVTYFKEVALSIESEHSLFPDVFPIRKNVGQPKNIPSHAGYYCIDIYSPINRHSYIAARHAVDTTLTAAYALEHGSQLAYALVRPPGHHAGRDSFGGYCYFNSTAIAAHYLSKYGKIAILDLDYHHGNGQQEIFYQRGDVLTVSIHGDPTYEYPYFSGYKEEVGENEGTGFNLNLPLKKGIDGAPYSKALQKACQRIQAFQPTFILVALGLDTAQNDPSGSWRLLTEDFRNNGLQVGALRRPTLVVQEGGYDCSVLGKNALGFLSGLWESYYQL